MPWTSRIDVTGRIVYTSVSHTLTFEEAAAHRAELAADPAFDPAFGHLIDLRAVERVELTTRDVVRLASESILSPGATEAIVAPSDATFGIARMYYAYRNQHPVHEDIFVCRTLEEAYKRLGVACGGPVRRHP